MAESELRRYEDLQPDDDDDVEEVLDALQKKRENKRQRKRQAEHEAVVRKLLAEAQMAIADDSPYDIEQILLTLHWTIKENDSLSSVLAPSYDGLDGQTKSLFRNHDDLRHQGQRPPNPETELRVLAEIAMELYSIGSTDDLSQYAPVKFATIDQPNMKSVDEPTPVGRLRIAKDDAVDLEDRAVEIPHKSCDHIGAIALPRRGKDSTLVSLGMNLQQEHGYSYVSIMDDGRMETPMVAIPNDEEVIRKNLEWFNQEPRAMPADVYVPAMGDVPDLLPNNFQLFTLGIDSLTPQLILRLAGVTKSDETVEARIKRALDKTLANNGSVDELIARMNALSQETDATIEWVETEERQNGENETEIYEATYHMEASKALEKAAQRVGQLAAEGLIKGPNHVNNIDMTEVIAENERVTVLCCNFLGDELEALKYVIMDLWLRLIYKARDNNPRLPRVCVEIRELKNIAPSKMGNVRYKDDIKTLRQTVFFLTTQGGSRRILLLGSTQKWNDIFKPVRTNIAMKLFLQLGRDEINTLDNTHHFSYEQEEQLGEFSTGWGMIDAEGSRDYPVQFRGAPCGLGLGDHHWRDRYGLAWGARVRENEDNGWKGDEDDPDWWVNVVGPSVHYPDAEGPPLPDTWYLLPEDLEGVPLDGVETEAGEVAEFPRADSDVQREWVDATLEARREYPIPNDLLLQPSGHDLQRSVSLDSQDVGKSISDLADEYGVPPSIRPWLQASHSKRQKLVEAVQAMDEGENLRKQSDITEHCSYERSTLANYWGKGGELEDVYQQQGKEYVLTPVGKQAASLDWESIEEELEEIK